MSNHPLYKKIYKKIKLISDKLKLKLIIEQSIKIKSNSFNKSRSCFYIIKSYI